MSTYIPAMPDHLLLITHTDTPFTRADLALHHQLRTDEEHPRIIFAQSKLSRQLGYDTISARTKNVVDTETVTTSRNLTQMINYTGSVFTPDWLGVCGIDLLTPVVGFVTFAGYLHCKEGDINISIPRALETDVYAQGNNGVFYNGRPLKKKERVDEFDEYILSRKLAQPSQVEILAQNPRSSNWISYIDSIRWKNRLYLLADNGTVRVNYVGPAPRHEHKTPIPGQDLR